MTLERRWFRLGDGVLRLDTNDALLRARFDALYGDCAVPGPGDLLALGCRVVSGPDIVEAVFDDPERLDIAQFAASVYPGRALGLDCSPDGRSLRAPADGEWRSLVSNLAVSRLQRLQRQVVFFHAASLALGGRGVLACGPKRSGKTTLALALACRGHALFGDELAAVRLATRELLPVRRSLAVRDGPAARAARDALTALRPVTEVFPDGEHRARAPIGRLFPATPATPVPLTTVLLLRTFAPTATAESVKPSPAVCGQLTPLAASLWNRPLGAVAFQLLRMLAASRIWWIDAGPPEATAELIERLVEAP